MGLTFKDPQHRVEPDSMIVAFTKNDIKKVNSVLLTQQLGRICQNMN